MQKDNSATRMSGFSLPISNLIKCIACIVIALHHYSQFGIDKEYISGPIYSVFRSVGGDLSVTLFFLLSGYGLMASETKKHLDLLDFMKKRFWRLLKPFWIANILFVFIYWILGTPNIATSSLSNAVLSCVGIVKFDGTMWFVHVLILLYIFFAIAIQVKNRALLVTSVLTLIFIIVSILCGMGSHFWSSAFAFPAGMAMYLYKDVLFAFARNIYVPIVAVVAYVFLLYGLVFYLHLDNSIWHQLNNILIVVLLVVVVSHLPNDCLNGFKLPKWLDAYYEMYLAHPKILYLMYFSFGSFWSLPEYLGFSVLGAIVLHFITSLSFENRKK